MKSIGCSYIDQHETQLNKLSRYLYDNPELGFQEHKSHQYLTSFLEEYGFKVEKHFLHKTAFRATFETADRPHFVIMVEYDALPEIGHACGHNLIAQSSIAAAVGLKETIKRENKACKLSVLGTPAEENGGGKLLFIKAGIFSNVDLAIMSHPFRYDIAYLPLLAITDLVITFKGKAAHASVSPWEGVNALDAAVLAYQNISCLRQQMHPECRLHGIFTKSGDATNIIPEVAELQYSIRAPTLKLMTKLAERVLDCCRGAALATGCQVEIDDHSDEAYSDLIPNNEFTRIFLENTKNVPETQDNTKLLKACQFNKNSDLKNLTGSSDAGNVSYVTPTIHPTFYIGSDAQIHTAEFAEFTGINMAFKYGIRQSKIMLGTLVDILNDDKVLTRIQDEFKERIAKIKDSE